MKKYYLVAMAGLVGACGEDETRAPPTDRRSPSPFSVTTTPTTGKRTMRFSWSTKAHDKVTITPTTIRYPNLAQTLLADLKAGKLEYDIVRVQPSWVCSFADQPGRRARGRAHPERGAEHLLRRAAGRSRPAAASSRACRWSTTSSTAAWWSTSTSTRRSSRARRPGWADWAELHRRGGGADRIRRRRQARWPTAWTSPWTGRSRSSTSSSARSCSGVATTGRPSARPRFDFNTPEARAVADRHGQLGDREQGHVHRA